MEPTKIIVRTDDDEKIFFDLFTPEFINGVIGAYVICSWDPGFTSKCVIIYPEKDDEDLYDEYAMGVPLVRSYLENVCSQADFTDYITNNIDDEPFQEPLLYVAELDHTILEIGGWERIKTYRDILTFNDLDFIRGVKKCFEWLQRPTSITILNTEIFKLVDFDKKDSDN